MAVAMSSSSSAQPTGDQKSLKKRLAVLAKKPQNKVCCDCPEKGPSWASILSPPENAPLGSNKLIAFLCMNCAGAHRQLGTHICRVKSITLDNDCEYYNETVAVLCGYYHWIAHDSPVFLNIFRDRRRCFGGRKVRKQKDQHDLRGQFENGS